MPVFALNTTLPPAQNVVAPAAAMLAIGCALTVTTLAREVAIHPLAFVNVTVYEPDVVAVYVDAVAPVIVTPFFFQT